MIDWARVFNRLFEIINSEGETYFGGPRFIYKIKEVDPYFPNYNQYIEKRRISGKSTSRRDYFYDILLEYDETNRIRIVNSILDDVRNHFPDKVAEIQNELGGVSAVPPVTINTNEWNADRLNSYLQEIDARIGK